MGSCSIRALAACAVLLLVSDVAAQTAGDSAAVASLVPESGKATIMRGSDTIVATGTTVLFHGDRVQVEPEGRAVIIYDAPPIRRVWGGAEPVAIDSTSRPAPRPAIAGSSDIWGMLHRLLTRLKGSDVEGPPMAAHGGQRGREGAPPALVLPPSSTMMKGQPLLVWWPASVADTQVTYHLAVASGVDSARCWRGGDVIWETTTQDTTMADVNEVPALAPGAMHRVEIWTSDQGGDFACMEVAGEEEQARLMEDRSRFDQGAADVDPATREVLWAGVLVEKGYYSDALTILHNLLQAHPDHPSANELWTYILRQAVP